MTPKGNNWRFESIEDLVGEAINPYRSSDLPLNKPRSSSGFVNFLDVAKRLGAEFFGFYLPYHKYHKSNRWGIYLMKEPIQEHCDLLYHSQEEYLGKEILSYEEVQQIFIYLVHLSTRDFSVSSRDLRNKNGINPK